MLCSKLEALPSQIRGPDRWRVLERKQGQPPKAKKYGTDITFESYWPELGGKEVPLMQNKSSCRKGLAQIELDGHFSNSVLPR